MKNSKTNRGFARVDFADRNNEACSVQDSSLATERAIWLGCDKIVPMVRGALGEGWKPLALPEGTLVASRMHLTQEMVAELLPLLQRFVETGSIGED